MTAYTLNIVFKIFAPLSLFQTVIAKIFTININNKRRVDIKRKRPFVSIMYLVSIIYK
uniref:Uncharacterized protein n=1 Tax=Elizabethkingia anophelis TaxID=1117645 RepID=A0A455ZE70_9FLAO|nr:TPA_exp: hypothetical protein [Elizabethkingia anophelis]